MAKKRLTNEAIVAALITEGSIKGAAATLTCTARTLYERMKEPAFKALYAKARADMLKDACAQLQGHLSEAVATLAAIMKDTETAPQTRANCAVSILQYAGRFTETADILERLEAVEAAQELQEV